MRRRFSAKDYVIFGLAAVGLIFNAGNFLIPIIVLGGIFLLYKFLPARGMQKAYRTSAYRPTAASPKKRKTSPFRVIPGNKDSMDDKTPKYH
ncbi:hypothetical protein N6H14_31300 [Paenibacillus sp. CC-CFT747]|nr:hypothetical protein N6H14_31300 [Paenibacillus sp. CC-CFT747]